MIFKVHYFAFNAGLSGVLILLTVFLRKYSDASSTEVGTLLMVLPLIAVFTKPFFCALADRHRRYRLYFILALLFTLIGFGAYTVLPFYPEFIAQHGRAAWYMLVLFTIIGYIAYGVVWSLGDAYAANVSHRTGESFGLIRLWGTVGWGVAGAVVGVASPYMQLPELVLGFLIFIATHVFEIILLSWWPRNEDFEMGDAIPSHGGPDNFNADTNNHNNKATIAEKPTLLESTTNYHHHQQLANITEKPAAAQDEEVVIALSQLSSGELTIQRTQSNSLAITIRVKHTIADNSGGNDAGNCKLQQRNSLDNLDRTIEALMAASKAADLEAAKDLQRKRISDLQMTIFKLVAMKHKSLLKYLLIFVALGTVYNIHWSYFFLHLEQLAHEGKGGDFSTLVAMCLVAQAVGETFCFIIAPWVVRKLGRDGAISLNAIAYVVRYFGNGLGIPFYSPYVAILTESLQGINYGIFYYLITDTALYYALLVDDIIPELYERGFIDERANLNAVRTSLRATMQGIFSGAFDGLGFGLGSLIAGLVLEQHYYEELWCYAGSAAFIIFVLHAIYELTSKCLQRQRIRQSGCSKQQANQFGIVATLNQKNHTSKTAMETMATSMTKQKCSSCCTQSDFSGC